MRWRTPVLLVSGVGLSWLTVTSLVVLHPDEDDVDGADVIVVLAGDEEPRLALGLQLWREDQAPVLLLSSVPDRTTATRTTALCEQPPAGVECFNPDPVSTRGEARALGELARQREWRSAIVVTSTSHVTRARVLIRHCFPGTVAAVGARDASVGLRLRAQRLAREVVGLGVAQIDRRC